MRYLFALLFVFFIFGVGCEPELVPEQEQGSQASEKLVVKASTSSPNHLIELHTQEYPQRYQKGCNQGRLEKTKIVSRDSLVDSTVVRAQVVVKCVRRKSGFTEKDTPGYPVYRDYSIQEISEGYKIRLLEF